MNKLRSGIAARVSLRRRQLIPGGRIAMRQGSDSVTTALSKLENASAALKAARRNARIR